MYHWCWRQRRDEATAVPFGAQTRIEHGEDSAIAAVSNQSTKPLLQREDRQRHLIFVERLPAARANRIDPRAGDRIARRGERQFVDDHATQRFADDVDALPET